MFDPIANGWRKLLKTEQKITPINIEWVDAGLDDGVLVTMALSMIPLVEGKSYAVTTDSGTFTVVCKKFVDNEGESILTLGNLEAWLDDYTGEGESFVYFEGEIDGTPMGLGADFNGGTTLIIGEVDVEYDNGLPKHIVL